MKTTPIQESANSTMHFKMTFKATLYALVSIAVMFIAIIPAKLISGIFSQDTTIFIILLTGFIALLEFVVWCFLSWPLKVYESFKHSKANGLLPDSPNTDVPIEASLETPQTDSQENNGKNVEKETNEDMEEVNRHDLCELQHGSL